MYSKEVTPVAELQRRKPPAVGRGGQKGELNKLTRTLKEAILAAFDALGGRDYVRRRYPPLQDKNNATWAHCAGKR